MMGALPIERAYSVVYTCLDSTRVINPGAELTIGKLQFVWVHSPYIVFVRPVHTSIQHNSNAERK
jgi:hypothetical protein